MDELSRYAAAIDLSNDNDSHVLMVRMVGGGKRVLDVGCWTGDLGTWFARFNRRVVGIEYDPHAAAEAKQALDDVVVEDVETLDFAATFGADAFDVIVFGDVLEHLTEPLAVLENSLGCLSPSGFVVASIPNVAHGSIRLALLQGEFRYTDIGLLDRTHLRWFTRESVGELFSKAGLAIIEWQQTTVDPLAAPGIPIDPAKIDPAAIESVRTSQDAAVYQFVIKAVRDDARHAIAELAARARVVPETYQSLEDDILRVVTVAGADTAAAEAQVASLVIEHELSIRRRTAFVRPALGSWPVLPGAVADAIVALGLTPAPSTTTIGVTSAGLDLGLDLGTAASLCALASRVVPVAERDARETLARTIEGIGPGELLVLVLSTATAMEQLPDTISALATRAPASQLVIVTDRNAVSVHWPLLEARWGRPAHRIEPSADARDHIALLAGASAGVVSTNVGDCATAASLGVPFALWSPDATPDRVLASLDATYAIASGHGAWDDLVRRVETALDELALSLGSVRGARGDELLEAHLALQRRVGRERIAIADRMIEQDLAVDAARVAMRRRDFFLAEIDELEQLLDVEHCAVTALQHDAAALAGAAASAVPRPRPLHRRVGSRLRRVLRGR